MLIRGFTSLTIILSFFSSLDKKLILCYIFRYRLAIRSINRKTQACPFFAPMNRGHKEHSSLARRMEAGMSDKQYLEMETAKVLNSLPLTWRAKRQIKESLRKMDENQAIPLILELRRGANGLALALDLIKRSRNL